MNSLFDYRNEVIKKAIWYLKYRNKKTIAAILARGLYDRLLPELDELQTFQNFGEPVLVAVPLSKKRLRERGYNQSALIAEELAQLTGFKLLNCVTKIKETPTQVSIKDRAKRLANLQGSFRVFNKEKIKDKNILLIDDVTSTGATIEELRKTLLEAGAGKVLGLTIAH